MEYFHAVARLTRTGAWTVTLGEWRWLSAQKHEEVEEQLGLLAILLGCGLRAQLARRQQLSHVATVRLKLARQAHAGGTQPAQVSGSVSIETEACDSLARECLSSAIATDPLIATLLGELELTELQVRAHSAIPVRIP